MTRAFVSLTMLALCPSAAALAQRAVRPPQDDHAFADAARVAAVEYQDRNAAIRAGYRQVGVSFPSMGEHWIQARLVIRGTVDSTRPSLLSYVVVRGRPVLAGVGWVLARDSASGMPMSPVPEWHEHHGTLAEASFGGMHGPSRSGVAVLHAWINVPNPAGAFKTDNWALPWVSAGLAPPAHPDPDAARALSLVSDGPDYWQEWMRWRGLDPGLLVPATDSVRVLLAKEYSVTTLEPLLSSLWQHWAGQLGLPHGEMEGH